MGENRLEPGLCNEFTSPVTPEEGTTHIGTAVFSTPSMLARMERCCLEGARPYLPEGFHTVGVTVNIKHMAATPVGEEVTTKCKLLEVNGTRLLYQVDCFDSKGKQIGKGTHGRSVINMTQFGK